jgi:Caspase domain
VNEHHYAVVLGINRYPGISDLAGPVNDASAFHRWVLDPKGGGLAEKNAWLVEASPAGLVFNEPYEAEPKRWQIDRALEVAIAKARTDIGDDPDRWDRSRFYLFLAGHGIAPAGSDSALLTAEARRDAFGSNFDVRLHVDWMRRCADFREVVVFADCCRNRVNNVRRDDPAGRVRHGARRPGVRRRRRPDPAG